MRRRAVRLLCAMVLGYLGLPVWAQAPPAAKVPPLPDPTPLGAPSEAPPIPEGPPAPPSGAPNAPPPNGSGAPNGVPNLNTAQPIIDGPGNGHGCDDCCCDRRGYWTIGGGVYYIQPVFESNPAFLTTSGGALTRV